MTTVIIGISIGMTSVITDDVMGDVSDIQTYRQTDSWSLCYFYLVADDRTFSSLADELTQTMADKKVCSAEFVHFELTFRVCTFDETRRLQKAHQSPRYSIFSY